MKSFHHLHHFIIIAAALLLLSACEKTPEDPQVGIGNSKPVYVTVVNNANENIRFNILGDGQFTPFISKEINNHTTVGPWDVYQNIRTPATEPNVTVNVVFEHPNPESLHPGDGYWVSFHEDSVLLTPANRYRFIINQDLSVSLMMTTVGI